MTASLRLHEPLRKLYFEDFAAGQTFSLGQYEVSREDILAFARQYDPQPFHLDEQAAEATLLKGLSASGWHSCTIFMRLLSAGLHAQTHYAGLFAIDEIRWRAPVRPGDRLGGRVTCIIVGANAPRPDVGLVTFHCEASNSRGQLVMSWLAQIAFESYAASDKFAPKPASGRPSSVLRNRGDHGIKYFDDLCQGDEIALGQCEMSA